MIRPMGFKNTNWSPGIGPVLTLVCVDALRIIWIATLIVGVEIERGGIYTATAVVQLMVPGGVVVYETIKRNSDTAADAVDAVLSVVALEFHARAERQWEKAPKGNGKRRRKAMGKGAGRRDDRGQQGRIRLLTVPAIRGVNALNPPARRKPGHKPAARAAAPSGGYAHA